LASDKSDFRVITIDTTITLWKLLESIKKEFEIEIKEQYRIKRLLTHTLILKEEMDSPCLRFEEFLEGGARIQIESGRPTTEAELGIAVSVYKNDGDIRHVFMNADITVYEAKMACCKEFGGEIEKDAQKYILYRLDAFDEPTYAMRRKQATLSASKVTTGDHLILKSEDNLLPDEKFKYSIHQTFSGLSSDSTFVSDIEVSRELTLVEFKDVLMDIP
jgi:hypothetical protein